MRQGSTTLGSLGYVANLGLAAVGIGLLILPFAVVGATLTPTPGWADEREATPAAATAPESERPAVPAAASPARGWLACANRQVMWRQAAARQRPKPRPVARAARPVKVIHTRATWYGPGFHGRRTASGERFNRHALTLASRHLPFGTRVRVVNPKTGRAAIGRVNDRGPFVRGYSADLSQALARRIGLRGSGAVRLEILPKAPKKLSAHDGRITRRAAGSTSTSTGVRPK